MLKIVLPCDFNGSNMYLIKHNPITLPHCFHGSLFIIYSYSNFKLIVVVVVAIVKLTIHSYPIFGSPFLLLINANI